MRNHRWPAVLRPMLAVAGLLALAEQQPLVAVTPPGSQPAVAATDQPAARELHGREYAAAVNARDTADLARAEYEKTYRPGDASPAAQEAFARVERLFKEAIESYSLTDIGVYCRKRLAGAYQYHGQKDKAVALLAEAQEVTAEIERARAEAKTRAEAPDWPELASLLKLLRRAWQEKVTREEVRDAAAKLAPRADQAIPRLMETFWREQYAYRWRTIWALGAINTPATRRTLLEMALDSDRDRLPWVRGAAREYVEVLPDKSEAARLLASGDNVVLQSAAVGLRGVRIDKDNIDRLLELMRSEDYHLRFRVVLVLTADPGGQFVQAKVAAIVRAIPDIPKMDKADGIWWPGSLTYAEGHYRTYIDALAKMKDARKPLEDETAGASKGDTTWRCLVLARAMSGERAVKPDVVSILQDAQAGMFRAWAADAMGQIGSQEDVALLTRIAREDPMQREIGGCGSPMNKDLYHPVRWAAGYAIKAIEGR